MKILIIAPTNFKVTDSNVINSGSIEQHSYLLSEALAARGHKVTLFATKDAGHPKNVKVKYIFNKAPKNYYKLNHNVIFSRDTIQASSALKRSWKYDYVSIHTMAGIPIFELLKYEGIKICGSTTIHWRFNDTRLSPLLAHFPNHPLIVTSRHAGQALKRNNILGVVHCGLKMGYWPFRTNKDDYLLFVGKLIPEKGVDLVVKAAYITGTRLIIAGRRIEERYPGFFDKTIKPYLSDKITYVGEVTGETKVKLFENAYCFIGPGRWAEPFGIVFLEAQACGTPVIAWNPGSSNDPIIEGITGYIIKARNDNEAVKKIIDAICKIKYLKPENCRKNITENFTIEKTAGDYEKIFTKHFSKFNNKRALFRNSLNFFHSSN